MKDTDILTYCLNAFPGETVEDVFAVLDGPARHIVEALRPAGAAGCVPLGARFGESAVAGFRDPNRREDLETRLAALGAHFPTANVFPQHAFQNTVLKEEIYRPDWNARERRVYTGAVGDLMAALPREGRFQTLSTVPLSFKPFGPVDHLRAGEAIATLALRFHERAEETGLVQVLALEPEPLCTLETTQEALRWFEDVLFARRWKALAPLGSRELEETVLRRHVGLCFDTCHVAVEYESPKASLDLISRSGVTLAKMQLSSALHLDEPSRNAPGLEALMGFAEPRFLHQVVARRRDGGLDRFPDLPLYLDALEGRDDHSARIHFHVPVFAETFAPGLRSTRTELACALGAARSAGICRQFEIETYTWDALVDPESAEAETERMEGILREIAFVQSLMEEQVFESEPPLR